MSIGKAVRDLIEARGRRPAEVADRLGATRNRVTFYRLLSGETGDPRISTLLAVCDALATTPGELLQLAGLLTDRGRPVEVIDVALRQAFGEVQKLNEDDRWLCLSMLRSVVSLRAKGSAKPRPQRTSRSVEPT